MTDKSQYSGSWQAGGILEAVQTFRAVGAAAAAQRARVAIVTARFILAGVTNI